VILTSDLLAFVCLFDILLPQSDEHQRIVVYTDCADNVDLFKRIRTNELLVYDRDELDGTNFLISEEVSRMNKRIHPSAKRIREVWCEPTDATGEWARSLFFDPAYLTIERIIAQRVFEPTKNDELMVQIVASRPAPALEYLVKWCSLPYTGCTWESDLMIGALAGAEHIARFHHSLRLPTETQLKAGRALREENKRPAGTVFNEKNPVPPFKDGRMLRDYQVEGVNWLTVNFFRKYNSILADEMGLGTPRMHAR
jgi:hypothetical protein